MVASRTKFSQLCVHEDNISSKRKDFVRNSSIHIMVKVVKSAAEFQQALKFVGLTVVDFYATWCGPCKMIAPLLDKFSTEYSNVNFVKVDVDELGDVAQQYEVSSMPTLIFFKNGEIVQKVIGANPAAIKQAIASNA